MTLQTMDIQTFESMLRRIVREELQNIIQEQEAVEAAGEDESKYADDAAFEKSMKKIFKSHKKVLDALA